MRNGKDPQLPILLLFARIRTCLFHL